VNLDNRRYKKFVKNASKFVAWPRLTAHRSAPYEILRSASIFTSAGQDKQPSQAASSASHTRDLCLIRPKQAKLVLFLPRSVEMQTLVFAAPKPAFLLPPLAPKVLHSLQVLEKCPLARYINPP